ncbi:MAG: (d)CMP kinase [Firmicutes bacterium]|nr:(d)CMP kinase [Bacillota bacterium]
MDKEIFQIAIDGTASSGKNTAAKRLARKFGFLFLDTGSLYRGITVWFMRENVDLGSGDAVADALCKMDLRVRCQTGATLIFLGEEDITDSLHDLDVCEYVFKVASVPEVRVKVREIQHKTAEAETLICIGRDITHVVFPGAKFKFYLTASAKVRAKWRLGMVRENNSEATLEQVRTMIEKRDYADKTREISPLRIVKGAVVVDATRLSPYQVVKKMEAIIVKKLCREG